jgi:acyl-coenzyme A thioesterase PaaI-like protein
MDIRTHQRIDRQLCGEPVEVSDGAAVVELTTTASMAADSRGLIHGGFVFGMADYAAMLAVNHPNVVLVGAAVQFLAPVVVGERLRASARITEQKGKRCTVEVSVSRGDNPVLTATLECASLSQHVLDRPEN